MGNDIHKPAIRFQGFTDAWEQRKLGAAVNSIDTGKSKFDKEGSSGNYAILGSTSVIGYDTEYDYEGDFILTARVGANAGSLYRHTGKVKISDNTVFIQASENIEFLYHLLTQFNIKKLSFGTGQPLVKTSELKNLELMMPIDTKEQIKIGDCFKALDNLITLHQRKYEKLITVKKSMLEKMFPRDDSNNPEIRFTGFTDRWEQRKLQDVTDEFKSGSFIATADIKENGEYPVYGGNGLRGYSSTYNHDGEFALIGRQGALCGNMNYSTGKAYFTEHAVAVKANSSSNTRFLYYLLDTMNLGQYSDQSAQPGLAVGKLVKMENMFPSKKEQDQIGAFFFSLDNLITLHHLKLEKLKNIKQSLLQNMFV